MSPKPALRIASFNVNGVNGRLPRLLEWLRDGTRHHMSSRAQDRRPTDFDIYNPRWWRFDAVMQPEARNAYQRLLAQGWTDTARVLYPNERMFTYWTTENAYRQKKGFRLDFILLSETLRPQLLGAGVDGDYRVREKPSDHAPAWILLGNALPAARSSA